MEKQNDIPGGNQTSNIHLYDAPVSSQTVRNRSTIADDPTSAKSKRRKKKRKSSSQKKEDHHSRPSMVGLFCRTTSIRGMGKLIRGPFFLRMIWLCFVVIMTGILLVATILLIRDFLRYDIGVHTNVLELKSSFPSLSICHHHSFSKEAYKIWDKNEIMSPSSYNYKMRKLIQKHIAMNDFATAGNLYNYDSLEVFYQNLRLNESKTLGHKPSVFINCNSRTFFQSSFHENCSLLDSYNVKELSLPNFLNCYTFEPDQEISRNISFFSVIVSLSPGPNYTQHEQGLLIDVFDQAKGLRVVVHEPGTLPNMERDGVHVEPGKFNEISYQPLLWNLTNTPVKACLSEDDEILKLKELDRYYNYTFEVCISLKISKYIASKCGCIYVRYNRFQEPTKDLPYCGNVDIDDFNATEYTARIDCLINLTYLSTDVVAKEMEFSKECRPRCTYYKYESTVSITKWRATKWQIHWLTQQHKAMLDYGRIADNKGNLSTSIYHEKYQKYLNKKNLSDIPENETRELDIDLNGENFAYVVLQRKASGVVYKEEKLILTVYVLLSRIGGFCSLTIGLTAAFAVEMIEFIYLSYFHDASMTSDQPSDQSKSTRSTNLESNREPLLTPLSVKTSQSHMLIENQYYNNGGVLSQSTPITHHCCHCQTLETQIDQSEPSKSSRGNFSQGDSVIDIDSYNTAAILQALSKSQNTEQFL